MKKGWKIFVWSLLIALSVGTKALVTYGCYKKDVIFFCYSAFAEVFFHMTEERFVYLVDAVIVLLLFYVCADRLKHMAAKISVGVALNVGYLAVLLGCNYYWQALQYNLMFEEQSPALTPFDMAKRGFELYFTYGYPAYHWLIAVMVAMCALILVFQKYKKAMAMKIKRKLVGCAYNSKSASLAMLCFNVLLIFFKRYLNEKEFEWIRTEYESFKFCSLRDDLDSKFDKIEEQIMHGPVKVEESNEDSDTVQDE